MADEGMILPERVAWTSDGAGTIGDVSPLLKPGGKAFEVVVPAASAQFRLDQLKLPQAKDETQRRSILNQALVDHRDRLASTAPAIMLDFGREQHGYLVAESAGIEPVELLVQLGESAGEAMNWPFPARHVTLPPGGKAEVGPIGFRFAVVWFLQPRQARGDTARIRRMYCRPVLHPVQRLGQFTCSDEKLNRIWEIGVRTTHLCMQEEIWDGIKRDRLPWMGDLLVEAEVVRYVFGDTLLIRKSMDTIYKRAVKDGRVQGHLNNIPTYTCSWVICLADEYRYSGDVAYVRSQRDALVKLLEFLEGELDDDGVFANKRKGWVFIDWCDDIQFWETFTNDQRIGGHLYLLAAMQDGAELLHAIGDPAAAHYEQLAESLRKAARERLFTNGSYGPRQQVNAWAILSGAAQGEQARAIARDVLTAPYGDIPGKPAGELFSHYRVTPYGNSFIIEAMARAGQYQTAMDLIRSYWWGMVERGATTWWEHFDPRDVPRNQSLLPGVGVDWASCYAYGISLCHGWGGGPTSWMLKHVLGVQPSQPGMSKVVIRPNLCDLKWAQGQVPLPVRDGGKRAVIKARYEQSGNGFTAVLDLPPGVEASIQLPRPKGRCRVYLQGNPVTADTTAEGRALVSLGAGHHKLAVRPQ